MSAIQARRGVTVAVIGGGPSGLVTTKELLAAEHAPTCFEQAPGPGGVFRYDEDDGVVWRSCHLTSSGLLTAFSDFPVEPEERAHLSAGGYAAYLTRYVEAFGLGPHLRTSTTVLSVRRERGGWEVRSVSPDGERVERFDAVAVCTGLHQNAHRPTLPGADAFRGTIVHGSEYRQPKSLAGRRVVVVGGGESGADLAAEAAAAADEAVLSVRRGIAVLPRLRHGQPNDRRTTRLFNAPAAWIAHTRDPADVRKRRLYLIAFLPFALADKVVQLAGRARDRARERQAADPDRARRCREIVGELLDASGGTIHEQFATKSDAFVKAIADGKLRLAPALESLGPRGVVFVDGTTFAADVVVLCTGFETRVPTVDETLATMGRYLHLLPLEGDDTLAFVGFIRPAIGAIPPLAELQARLFAQVVSGTARLPDAAERAAWVARDRKTRTATFRAHPGRLEHLVDYTPICDQLARAIGCLPRPQDVARESRRFRTRFSAGPFVAAQYRLVGPGARPELARGVIESLPLGYPLVERAVLRGRWQLSRLLAALLGAEYGPRLELR